MNEKLPTLYARNKDGSIQMWKVGTSSNEVIVVFGRVGGSLQSKTTVCEAKNIGRSNETTAEEQAVLEAQSKWEKQVRLGYKENVEDLEAIDISPMLAQDASKKPHAIVYPCHLQHKLDGNRCFVKFVDGVPKFISRGNKVYEPKGNILRELQDLHEETGFDEFDGEFYIHGLPLQKITSLVKKWRSLEDIEKEIDKDFMADIKRREKAIKAGEETWKDFNKVEHLVYEEPVRDSDRYSGYCSYDLKLMVFDVPDCIHRWEDRATNLQEVIDYCEVNHLTNVEGVPFKIAYNEEEVRESIGQYMQDGYEGTIIRNFRGIYEYGQRSADLLKWKTMQDEEGKILSVTKDKNGEGVYTVVDKFGVVTNMKKKGTFADRNYERCLEDVGKFCTFKYQQKTVDGKYQFAVMLGLREVDPETWEVLE